jgi:cellulose 1,4-beta-cellobiosidase
MTEEGGTFSELATGVTETSYLVTGLNSGTTYEFKIEARNSYGYSGYSETLSLLSAFVP